MNPKERQKSRRATVIVAGLLILLMALVLGASGVGSARPALGKCKQPVSAPYCTEGQIPSVNNCVCASPRVLNSSCQCVTPCTSPLCPH